MGTKGVGLLELMFAVGIFSVVIFAGTNVLVNTTSLDVEMQESQWVTVRHQELRSFMKSEGAWLQIVADNPAMNCFATNCAGFGIPQNMKLTIDGVTLNGNLPGTGMTRHGDFCTTFDPINGDPNCVFGLNLKWQALCDDAACTHPQPKMTVDFVRKDDKTPLNTMPYNRIVVFKDPKLGTLDEVCTSMGGALVATGVNPPTYVCNLPTAACDVAAGEYVLGFKPDGSVDCGKPNLGQCPQGSVLIGFNANGSINCDPSPCPP